MAQREGYSLSVLRTLEAESIHILREVAAECERPVMMYSVGKDSSTMVRLAQKAFYPGQDSLSAAAHRYGVQVSRDVRVPRPLLQGDRRGAARPSQRGSIVGGRESLGSGHGEMLRAAEDAGAARRAQAGRLRRGDRRRSPRRGALARQGADLLVPRLATASGIRRTSARSCGISTTAG